MKTHKTSDFSCWACGKVHNHAYDPADPRAIPAEGSLTVCVACAEVGVFTFASGDIAVRKPTPKEQKEIDASPTVRNLCARVKDWNEYLKGASE